MTTDQQWQQLMDEAKWLTAVAAARRARTSDLTPEQIADEMMASWQLAEVHAAAKIKPS